MKLQATKARNEYLLNMDAANSSIQKYFVDDLSDLIDCMDYGFHQVILIWTIIFFVKLHEIMIFFFFQFSSHFTALWWCIPRVWIKSDDLCKWITTVWTRLWLVWNFWFDGFLLKINFFRETLFHGVFQKLKFLIFS